MRKALIGAAMIVLLCVSYIAWPFWSAWKLRQAVKSGNVTAIERMVEWRSVRATLKSSLTRYVGLLQQRNRRGLRRRRGLWQRTKAYFTRSAVDRFVNRMVTPRNLPRLFSARETFRHRIRPAFGLAKPARAFAGTWLAGGRIARFADSLERVERVVFTGLRRVEIEIVDRYRPDRHYISVLQLIDFDWKLVGLHVVLPRN